jgi:hypothetical protein
LLSLESFLCVFAPWREEDFSGQRSFDIFGHGT